MVMALTDHYLVLSICSLKVIRFPLLKFKNIRKNIFRLNAAQEIRTVQAQLEKWAFNQRGCNQVQKNYKTLMYCEGIKGVYNRQNKSMIERACFIFQLSTLATSWSETQKAIHVNF